MPPKRKLPKVDNWDDDDQVEAYKAAKEEASEEKAAAAEKKRLTGVAPSAVEAEVVAALVQIAANCAASPVALSRAYVALQCDVGLARGRKFGPPGSPEPPGSLRYFHRVF
jgi:hypothetical protein